MRTSLHIFASILIVAFALGCNSKSEEAAAYNDRLIAQQEYILDALNELDSTLNALDTTRIDDAYHILRGRIREGLRQVDSIGTFREDESLQTATTELFKGYDEIVAGPYQRLIELMELPDTAFTQVEQKRALMLEDEIIEGVESLHQDFILRQNDFGERYNVVFK